MNRTLLLLIFIVTACFSVNGQGLYTPRDVKEAYKKGTRSIDGKPGKNYWQNRGRYDINITALPPDRNVKGSESIRYINNSPDTINNPVIKLFLNIHKPGVPRAVPTTEDYITSGVHIDGFSVNGKKREWNNSPYSLTWQRVRLPEPLMPGDSVDFTFDWHYEISLKSGREGMIDSTTYFLAYFYPRVAVYDDYNGWDMMDFREITEFYSDFNDYTVSINVPKNYIVWGTGTLQNPGALLQPEFANRFKESLTADKTIRVATKEELDAKRVTAQNAINTWQFTANNIPDVAFALSNHFVWDAGSVVVDDATKRRASVQAAYNDTAADYRRMVEYGRHALDWLSHSWPGIPYPYEKTTIFQGYAGMEYPMMANDETYTDTVFSRFVAEHEIAHTYMPFYMGINETRYGFMDEGWATTFELLIGREDIGKEKAEEAYKEFRVSEWINDAAQDEDIPIITPGDVLGGNGFGNNEYGKASLGYLAMKDLLGDDLFKKCLHEYMNRWHGKHPIPWDFFYTFNDVAKKNLNWFWNNWYFTNGYIDLSLQKVSKTANGWSIAIGNIGGFAAPGNAIIKYKDGSTETKHFSPAIWEKNQKQVLLNITTKKKIQSVEIDGGIFMDANVSDNTWTAK
ncbi:MAG: M1 family metallopeptidase [Bacteroidota bacterium]